MEEHVMPILTRPLDKKVLIVDDDASGAQLMAFLVRHAATTVAVATSGDEALRLAQTEAFAAPSFAYCCIPSFSQP